jgi:NNP family nitrate/nitrite transporter-like MFS transporter
MPIVRGDQAVTIHARKQIGALTSSTLASIWTAEDKTLWEAEGRAVAQLNLWISVPCLFLAFAVWQLWSVVAVNLNALGFKFSTNQLFWLAAAPGLSGATLRIFYSFMVPIFGGRRWTALSTASLLIPAIGIGFAVQDSTTSYPAMLLLALLCGLGGSNFSSSMANISFFFPKERKGSALAVNAGLANLGISSVQFLAPLVITMGIFGVFGGDPQTITSKPGQHVEVWAQNAAFIWVPFIALAAFFAWLAMNDIASDRASFADQAVIFKRRHNWIMCWLYLGTFGSFIGYSAGFPLLIQSQFAQLNALQFAWLGPLVGACARPFGGWLADRLGGARVTFWNFVVMAGAAAGVLAFLPADGSPGNFAGFLSIFLVLFLASGIGNGSTFRMIAVIFLTERQREAAGCGYATENQAAREGNKEAAAVLGFSSAIGAYGGFFIPKSYGTSIALTGSPQAALCVFVIFYLTCIAITWWFYARKGAGMPC